MLSNWCFLKYERKLNEIILKISDKNVSLKYKYFFTDAVRKIIGKNLSPYNRHEIPNSMLIDG